MCAQKVCALFALYRNSTKNLYKTSFANSHMPTSKGTRKVAKARKYVRPEDLEDPHYYGVGPKKDIERLYESLLARGFAKEQAAYRPPSDLEQELLKVCKKTFGSQLSSDWKSQSLDDPLMKYKVLTKAIQQFKKDIPNSELHKMKKIEDLFLFLSMKVDGSYHYDALVRDSDKLPPNLHVMPDSPVFNAETDTFFDGITAFPGRKRIIHTKFGEKFEKTIEWPNV